MGSGSRWPKRRRRIGSGNEESRRTHAVNAIGEKSTSQSGSGNLKRTKSWACQLKAFGTMSPPMDLCWECQAGGVRVVSGTA